MQANQKPVSRYMSSAPVSIQQTAELLQASELMQRHDIRHLPVLEGEKVVGVVSERDMAIAEALIQEDWEQIPIAEVMTPDPYAVGPDTPVAEVARSMAERKYGCVLVEDSEGHLLGLFSTTDALRALSESG